ncbi:MAG: type III-A CRISPR-associated protein Cas10/Csm1 [Magnetococcales bacterium]|nr:type III-A CRISPR-associated protein Cas10/Csm1 [Magnetococcales bacterium]
MTVMERKRLLEASARFALSALLHDLGKFAERAGMEAANLDGHKAVYCPLSPKKTYSHVHAAYTAMAVDVIERSIPDIRKGEMTPFSSWGDLERKDDSLINAAAMHHKPETKLQKIIAQADRLASGFERSEADLYQHAQEEREESPGKRVDHYTARLWPLLETITPTGNFRQPRHRYPLKAMAPETLFPVPVTEHPNKDHSRKEYESLWQDFIAGLEKIPSSHRHSLPLWLDHFDSLWLTFTYAIPSATATRTADGTFLSIPADVSLHDHSKAVAALAVALWRHEGDGKEFLLIQGDFFGIQEFIFHPDEASEHAAKRLRGRSFMVALLTELAAMKVLEAFDLPATSQITNAAGKFLIVAPRIENGQERLQEVQKELDRWFLQHTFGNSGIGLAATEAECADFGKGNSFKNLMDRLHRDLDRCKRQRFDLCNASEDPVFAATYDHGACTIDGRMPAVREAGKTVCPLCRDQEKMGSLLVKKNRLLITRLERGPLSDDTLALDYLGYRVTFTGSEEISGRFGNLVREETLLRAWDFSLPENGAAPLWNGYARRAINGFVSRDEKDQIVEFSDLATKGKGVAALGIVKGDVDNLGEFFRNGLQHPTFARMASLSRQLNSFFALCLPWRCRDKFPNTYTIFAGGDDFFLLGPWKEQLDLLADMRQEFARYVRNEGIHFSAGFVMTKPGIPVPSLAELSEHALGQAKKRQEEGKTVKNAVTCWQRTVSWDDFEGLRGIEKELTALVQWLEETHKFTVGTAYLYGLLHLCAMANGKKPEDALWRSWFVYRTWRMLVDRIPGLDEAQRKELYQRKFAAPIGERIAHHKENFKIALFAHLYQQREKSQ